MHILSLVLSHSMLKFGDVCWVQGKYTAMGASCVCIYATLYFACFKQQHLLWIHWTTILFYKQQISNIFGVWIPDSANRNTWEGFKEDINNQSALNWSTTKLSKAVTFLDLEVTISPPGYIVTCTYQK